MRLDSKNSDLLDDARDVSGWSDPAPFLCTFDAGSKKFYGTSLATRSGWKASADSSDKLDFDAVAVADSVGALEMAALLGDVAIPNEGSKTWLVVHLRSIEGECSSAAAVGASIDLADALELDFDERDKDCSFEAVNVARRSFWWKTPFRYCSSKQLPDELAYVYCRNRFLSLIDTVWNNSFIIRPRLPHRSKSVKAISRASAIANLLLLGRGGFNTFSKKGKCPAWQVSALKNLEVPPTCMSPKMQEIYHEVARLQDVADFWMTASDNYGWALRLATSDLEADRIEETKEKIATMAELIDLESYLDAYDAGVPASDLLA